MKDSFPVILKYCDDFHSRIPKSEWSKDGRERIVVLGGHFVILKAGDDGIDSVNEYAPIKFTSSINGQPVPLPREYLLEVPYDVFCKLDSVMEDLLRYALIKNVWDEWYDKLPWDDIPEMRIDCGEGLWISLLREPDKATWDVNMEFTICSEDDSCFWDGLSDKNKDEILKTMVGILQREIKIPYPIS